MRPYGAFRSPPAPREFTARVTCEAAGSSSHSANKVMKPRAPPEPETAAGEALNFTAEGNRERLARHIGEKRDYERGALVVIGQLHAGELAVAHALVHNQLGIRLDRGDVGCWRHVGLLEDNRGRCSDANQQMPAIIPRVSKLSLLALEV